MEDIRMIELIEEIGIIKSINQTKKGNKDDSPLTATINMGFMSLKAADILPHFHPCLNSLLFAEECYRFGSSLKSLKWEETHNNMEMETLGNTFQVVKVSDYYIYPRFDKGQEGDDRHRVSVYCKMVLEISTLMLQPFNLLSESINSEITLNLRASQLQLEEMQPATPKIKVRGKKANNKGFDLEVVQ